MNCGERYRRVQIIVHPGFEFFQRLFSGVVKFIVDTSLSLRFLQTRAKIAQALDGFLRALQRVKSEIELLAAGNAEQKIADCCRRKAFAGQIAKRVIVAFRLRHRLAFDFEVFKVQPVTHKFFPSGAFALRDLILMMRKNQIDAP